MALVTEELCKRVKDPITVLYLHSTLNQPLRLGCTMPPKVIVSIDAAFANRDMMKSTSGMCVTSGVGNFITSSKVQKLNSLWGLYHKYKHVHT